MENYYFQLSMGEREWIAIMRSQGRTVSEIARALSRHKSTIAREVRRNGSRVYDCYLGHRAQARALVRQAVARQRPRLKNDRIRRYVIEQLKAHWSPEIIAGCIGQAHPGLAISHSLRDTDVEAIYQYVYHPTTPQRRALIGCLWRAHRKRKKKGLGRKERRTKIPNRIPIDDRPAVVAARTRFGDWERDSLISRKSAAALNTLTERKSRLVLLTKLPRKGAVETAQAIVNRLSQFPTAGRRTLTLDNGTEHVLHETITDTIDTECYFCHPYCSWERGTNEQINGSALGGLVLA